MNSGILSFLLCLFALSVSSRNASAQVIPTDGSFKSQRIHYVQFSYLPDEIGLLHTPFAWEITTGNTNVRVAIVSSGIDSRLHELSGRVVPGYNFVDRNTNTMDIGGQGTRMATILGANANNPNPLNPTSSRTLGIVGVDWQCQLMPVKVSEHGYLPMKESLVAQGIEFAATNGCKIIVVGITTDVLGTEFAPTRISSAISNAVSQGAIVISAAGSTWRPISDSAPKDPLAITVGGADAYWDISTGNMRPIGVRRSESSNTGNELDFVSFFAAEAVSPGWEDGFGPYNTARGTAYSAAIVGGVCSLMAALRPDITAAEAYRLLAAGALDRTLTNNPTWNPEVGWGLVNAYNSVLLAGLKIDSVKNVAANQIELSWPSPPDAQRRGYFRLENRSTLADSWQQATTGQFTYTTNRTTWTGPLNEGFYRVAILGPDWPQ